MSSEDVELNRQQEWMANNLDSNLVVVAGAGSGKTLSMVQRYNNLIDSGVNPEEIILTTFGKEASEEIEERVDVDPDENKLNIGTIHSLCRQIIRQEYRETNYSSQPDSKVGYGRKKFIDDIIEEHMDESDLNKRDYDLRDDIKFVTLKNIDAERRRSNFPEEAEPSFDVLTQQDKNKIGQFTTLKKFINSNFQSIYADYREKMYEENVMDYGQMIFEVWLLLKENKDVREEYSSKYKHIMVDEAQDLNKIQYDIFKWLSGGENLVLVGDSAQCIYNFRGSDPTLMKQIMEDMDADRLIYEKNYRSYQEIVDVFNHINTKLEKATEKSLIADKGYNKEGNSDPVAKEMNPREVAEEVVQLIEKGYDTDEIAILGRTNRDIEEYQKELERLSVPTQNAGNDNFTEKWDVNKAYSYIRAVMKKDDKAIEGLMKNRNIYNIKQIRNGMDADNLVEHVENDLGYSPDNFSDDKAQKLKDDLDFVDRLSEEDMFEEIEDKKFNKYGFTDSVQAMEDIYKNLGPDGFFKYMELDREEAVTVSTVHQAKGREWDVVFVVNTEDGNFPKEENPEEARIFYVACSRPKEKLYVTWKEDPSRFARWVAG